MLGEIPKVRVGEKKSDIFGEISLFTMESVLI